jgi:hypothetical protein
MTPTAVLIAVGAYCPEPTTLVGFCLSARAQTASDCAGFCRDLPAQNEIPCREVTSLGAGTTWGRRTLMSSTDIGIIAKRESIAESLPELVAGLAVIVLTILGLASVSPSFLVEIATIVFGVGLLLYGSATLSQMSRLFVDNGAADAVAGVSSGWSIVLLAGAAGIVLGILALLGVSSIQLVAIAVIAFGASLLISSNANMRLRILLGATATPNSPIERLVRDTAADTAGLQTMTGLSAIVLGILALSGFAPTTLVLIALLGLGCFATMSSAFIAGAFARAFQVAPRS